MNNKKSINKELPDEIQKLRSRVRRLEKFETLYKQISGKITTQENRGNEPHKKNHIQGNDPFRISDHRLRSTLDNMIEGCQIIGFDWRYRYVNNALTKHGRQTKDELIGSTMMERYPGIENTKVFSVLRRCMEERISHFMETEFTFPDGSKGWFELSIQPVPEGIFVLSYDITERKRAEERINKLNRTYVVLSDTNHAILRTEKLQTLFKKTCRIVVKKGKFPFAWIGLLDESTQKLQLVASADNLDGYFEKMNPALMEESHMSFLTSKALFEGEPAICDLTKQDQGLTPAQEMTFELGLRSLATFPLKVNGKVRGVINIYSGNPNFFDNEELHLLEKFAMDISFAIEVSEKEAQRLRKEKALLKLHTVGS
jgi:PAS domain S-box-containing protein